MCAAVPLRRPSPERVCARGSFRPRNGNQRTHVRGFLAARGLDRAHPVPSCARRVGDSDEQERENHGEHGDGSQQNEPKVHGYGDKPHDEHDVARDLVIQLLSPRLGDDGEVGVLGVIGAAADEGKGEQRRNQLDEPSEVLSERDFGRNIMDGEATRSASFPSM